MRRKGNNVVSIIPRSCLRICFVLLGVLLMASCASPPKNDPDALAELEKLNDPIELTNRGIFSFNQFLDTIVIKPATGIYRTITPVVLREAIHSFLQNLRTPVILTNDLLQGEGKRAGNTIARFFINSTVGLLGFMDPATYMGFKRHDEDFGQTLAVWGVGEGPFLMLPLFGASNPRDLIGKVADFFIDPINIWASNSGNDEVTIVRTLVTGIDTRDQFWDALEDIEKNSIDPYASIRSLYRQRRNDHIRNGAEGANPPVSELERDFEVADPDTRD